jgi:hypothetical protein
MLWRLRAGRPSGFIEPCLPSIARKPPTGPQWLHEIKHDGYRHGGRVRLFTRRGFEWSDRYPRIVEANGRAESHLGHNRWRGCLVRRGRRVRFEKVHGTTITRSCSVRSICLNLMAWTCAKRH